MIEDEQAIRHVPELIISDVMMPELDSYGVIRQLQSGLSTAMIPFIFLTAKADRQSMRYGMELGADMISASCSRRKNW